MFGRELKTWTKSGSSPDYGWRSEESGDDPARLAAKRVWIVDPIDVTRAYIQGLTDWTIAAALVDTGRPVLGTIFAPAQDAMFAAAAGRGARLNGTSIRASAGAELQGVRVAGPRRHLDRLVVVAPGIE